MIAFVQPFGLSAPGGGSRILRGLLEGEHPPVLSVNTGLHAAAHFSASEIHLPLRPSFGRLERTRLHGSLGVFDGAFRNRFQNRFRKLLRANRIEMLHIIPHGYDFVPASHVARELNIPYFLTIHDDLEYLASGHLLKKQMIVALGEVWRNAKGIFAISDEIGKEYSSRYGARDYELVTDGLNLVAKAPQSRPAESLRIYFMGLFHISYGAGLRALLDALQIVRGQHPNWDISVTCRCGSISCKLTQNDVPVTVLPFAPESQVEKDLLSADVLYQPLPFAANSVSFGKFSLSTKLVTYLGSGLPILYHGPLKAAACNLLTIKRAAYTCTTLDPETIAKYLVEFDTTRESIVNNALKLARSDFMLADQQHKFWRPIEAAM